MQSFYSRCFSQAASNKCDNWKKWTWQARWKGVYRISPRNIPVISFLSFFLLNRKFTTLPSKELILNYRQLSGYCYGYFSAEILLENIELLLELFCLFSFILSQQHYFLLKPVMRNVSWNIYTNLENVGIIIVFEANSLLKIIIYPTKKCCTLYTDEFRCAHMSFWCGDLYKEWKYLPRVINSNFFYNRFNNIKDKSHNLDVMAACINY